MLGLTSTGPWRWAAFGKHPAARDYFSVGETDPLLSAFANWVDDGYRSLGQKRNGGILAWRFWAKGPRKNTLVCGIARDSSDSLGRPYPLLMIGTGPVRKWEKKWANLPALCDPIWAQMEKLALGGAGKDIRWLDAQVRRIHPPGEMPGSEGWGKKRAAPDSFAGEEFDVMEGAVKRFSMSNEVMVPLANSGSESPFGAACKWHRFLMHRLKSPPNAVFMGGPPETPKLAAFKMPLSSKNFMILWAAENSVNV